MLFITLETKNRFKYQNNNYQLFYNEKEPQETVTEETSKNEDKNENPVIRRVHFNSREKKV